MDFHVSVNRLHSAAGLVVPALPAHCFLTPAPLVWWYGSADCQESEVHGLTDEKVEIHRGISK